LEVTAEKWFNKQGCNKLHSALHTKQTAKLCRLMSKELIEINVSYSSAVDRQAGKGRLNERHAKTRIKPATIVVAIKRRMTFDWRKEERTRVDNSTADGKVGKLLASDASASHGKQKLSILKSA